MAGCAQVRLGCEGEVEEEDGDFGGVVAGCAERDADVEDLSRVGLGGG